MSGRWRPGSMVEREAGHRLGEAPVVVAAASDIDGNRGANREHGVSRRGHGGRGHRVSPKVVRERRAAGIQPRRGHNFDSRRRNERASQLQAAEAKVYDESRTAIVARLIEKFGIDKRLRDDMEQEIWVRLLEGETEAQISGVMRIIRTGVAELEVGDPSHLRLDAPYGRESSRGGFATLGDLVDQEGRVFGGRAPLPWELATNLYSPLTQEQRADKESRYRHALDLAALGASLRLISSETGLARNTVAKLVGPRSGWGVLRKPSAALCCVRCGFSPSVHTPSYQARKGRPDSVCDKPVLDCKCGGWRSLYSEMMCRPCRRQEASWKSLKRSESPIGSPIGSAKAA